MKRSEKIICITCPKGCTLDVNFNGETVLDIKGGCKRGHDYVISELNDPRRMVASTVQIHDSNHPLLPVFTSKPFPKPQIHKLLIELRKVHINAPIKMGDVIISNVLDTGIDILASRDMQKI